MMRTLSLKMSFYKYSYIFDTDLLKYLFITLYFYMLPIKDDYIGPCIHMYALDAKTRITTLTLGKLYKNDYNADCLVKYISDALQIREVNANSVSTYGRLSSKYIRADHLLKSSFLNEVSERCIYILLIC